MHRAGPHVGCVDCTVCAMVEINNNDFLTLLHVKLMVRKAKVVISAIIMTMVVVIVPVS